MASVEHVREQTLDLSEPDRAKLAHDLIRSLDGDDDPAAGPAWATEIERRAQEVRDGTAELVEGAEALARARARLREPRR